MDAITRGRRVFKLLMITFPIAGSVTQVSSQYFLFATTTAVLFGTQETVFSESVSACFRAGDILDYDSIFQETGRFAMQSLVWEFIFKRGNKLFCVAISAIRIHMADEQQTNFSLTVFRKVMFANPKINGLTAV